MNTQELNKAIAELRGDGDSCHDECGCPMAMSDPDCTDCNMANPNPYVTDIRYAMELLHEMPIGTHFVKISDGWLVEHETTANWVAREDTLPYAIAKAYYKWKT